MKNSYVEYKWEKVETCAHNYIIPAIIKIIRKLNIPSTANILDVGSGGGNLLWTLYNKLDLKNVYGFDASVSAIELAKKNFPALAKNFFIHNAYESKLPSDVPKEYDLIISMEVIEHLYDPKTYLENIYMWLKRNGFLIITTPYHGYFKNLALSIFNAWDRHFTATWVGGHIKFFSKKTLSLMLKNTGFEIVSFYGCGRILFLWKTMIIVARKV